jgi:FtsZ-binding cell division protein ZapB
MKTRGAATLVAIACAACAGVQETPERTPVPQVAVAAPTVTKPAPPVTPPAPPPKVERAAPAEVKTPELDSLLAEFERLRRLPPADVAREHDNARQAYVQSRTDSARVKLAMALSVPGAAAGEEMKALELLDPLVKNPSSPLHGIAFLISAFIQEQRRLASLVQGLQQNVQGLQQNNQALQQNVHGLQQKLDALRTLERSLTERGEPARRR